MHGKSQSESAGLVVVGVDGSPGAREALRWAAAEARLRATRLRVVHAWTFGYPGAGGGGYGYPYIGGSADTLRGAGLNDLREAAEELVDQVIADVADGTDGLEIEPWVTEGSPVDVLVHAVTAGDLLVVGSRGHGGFAGLVLGSVSQQCAHHAPCPVVIVRTAKPSTNGSNAAGSAQTTIDPMIDDRPVRWSPELLALRVHPPDDLATRMERTWAPDSISGSPTT